MAGVPGKAVWLFLLAFLTVGEGTGGALQDFWGQLPDPGHRIGGCNPKAAPRLPIVSHLAQEAKSMMKQAAAQKLQDCPTCRGRGVIELELTELFIPEKTQVYSTAKLILAFIIGFLVCLPATLGLYWEFFLPKGGP